MIEIILRYGLTNRITQTYNANTKYKDVITPNILAMLNAPETVTIMLDNQPVDLNETIQEGDELTLERQAARKAE